MNRIPTRIIGPPVIPTMTFGRYTGIAYVTLYHYVFNPARTNQAEST